MQAVIVNGFFIIPLKQQDVFSQVVNGFFIQLIMEKQHSDRKTLHLLLQIQPNIIQKQQTIKQINNHLDNLKIVEVTNFETYV